MMVATENTGTYSRCLSWRRTRKPATAMSMPRRGTALKEVVREPSTMGGEGMALANRGV